MKLEDAKAFAADLIALLNPHCERIEIAGSVRWGKPEVKDIDLVAIPKLYDILMPGLDWHLDSMLGSHIIRHRQPKRWGERYKAFTLDGIPVDLFLVRPPAQWGVILALRTGPDAYSQYLVTQALRLGLQVKDGAVSARSNLSQYIAMPEEEDFFKALGLAWVPPEERA